MDMINKTALILIGTLILGCHSAHVVESDTSLKSRGDNYPFSETRATFRVEGQTVYVKGYIDRKSVRAFKKELAKSPQVNTLAILDIDGSDDDHATIKLCRFIREKGLRTHLFADSAVASGGTDVFLAGKTRTMEPGALIGVHSWDDDDFEGRDLEKGHPEHNLYLDYYREMGIPESFYWFTLNAASADGMHWMTAGEIEKFKFLTGSP